MDQRPLSRLFRLFVAGVASLTLLLGPLAPMAFAETPGPGTPSSNPAAGVGGGIPVAVLADAGKVASNVYDTIWTQITRAVMVAFFNALQIFFGQIAYDAANYIATAGQGEQPVFHIKDMGTYLQDVASDAAGGFIGSLSNDQFFRTTGFDLCKPKDLKYMLRLQLSLGNFFPGLQGRFQRPAPNCQFKDIINNWNSFFTTMSNRDVFSNIDASLNTNANDVGVSLNIFNRFNAQVSLKTAAAQLQRQEGGGFKAVTNILSGDVKTPAAIVGESTKEAMVRAPGASQLTIVGAMLSTGFQQGALQLLQYTASVFLNTLASKLLKRVFEGGLTGEFTAQSSLFSADNITTGGKTDSRNANIDLRTPNLFKVTDFEVMADFIACPQTNRGTWNCTVDQALAQAIQSQSDQGAFTVRDAIGRNYLHGDWRLIPDARVRENTDARCFTYAYCAGNLRKMRLLRILSVGFEFAANSPENVDRCASSQGCVTLNEVVNGFTRCNAQGQRDRENPWCHLVDPNWVVTLPPQQCAITGFGETLLTPSLNQRREECQDVKTCLKRNDRGECVGGYGYCMAENTVYRFGADQCPASFATCRTYQTRNGAEISYLRNSLDYAVCNADNVGCLWYASTRDPAGNQPEQWVGTTTTGPRVYFDKTMESCPEGEEGCTKLSVVRYGQPALNLVLNSSFERLSSDVPPKLQNWFWNPDRTFVAPTVATGTASADGANGVDLPGGIGSLGQTMPANPSRVYTVSYFVRRQVEGSAADATLDVIQYSDAQYRTRVADAAGSPMAREFRGEGCTRPSDGSARPSLTASTLTGAWRRYECTFLSSASSKGFQLRFTGTNVIVDAVQLEESEFANVYQDGLNTALQTVHLKVAPEEFACSGSPSDNALCSKFATVCRQNEAGCQGYTDTKNGGPEVPAIVTQNDLCPQSCVGYDEFRKLPSSFDLTRDIDERFNDPQDPTSTFFIPTTGQSCSQAEVGCESFTNIEASAAGGEQTATFSYLRSCRKPGPDSKTYFTWEGSDVTGYQLRTWSLVKEATVAGGPMIVLKRNNGDLFFKNPANCNARSWSTGADADCRQFYDADGDAFYRYYSQTVLSTDQCTTYRLNVTNRADCELTDGTYNAASGVCLYQAFAPQSTVCRKEAAGCRGYAGSAAGNVLTVLNQSFRTDRGGFSNGTLSSEALLVGDKSLRLDVARDASVTTFVGVSSTDADLFRVTFWAKAATVPSQIDVRAVNPDQPFEFNPIGTVTLTPDWQRFTLGPFQGVSSTADLLLAFVIPSQPRAQVVFLDEVSMSRIQDVSYLIENSWKTPVECDRTISNVPLPQAQLGCRAYRNRSNQTVNVRQFSRLCREQSVGCSAFIDTRNSNDIAEQTFVRGDRPGIGFTDATTTRPADRYVYLIDEPSKRCRPENASCRAFGKPNFTADRQSIVNYTTVYLKDDITKYDVGLCRPSELFCDEFSTKAGKEYFRDPQNHACEYKQDQDNVVGAADPTTKYSGWFIKGSTRPCYPSLLADGASYSLALRGDPSYAGYGGICEAQYAECTEFRDPNDKTDPTHRSGKPYFFLNNEKIDTQTCAGNADPTRGCILLRDMGDAFLKYSTPATYKKFQDRGNAPLTPVDCSLTPQDPSCSAVQGTCSGSVVYSFDAAGALPYARLTLEEMRLLVERNTPSLLSTFDCHADAQCTDATPQPSVLPGGVTVYYQRTGTCKKNNDANLIVKTKLDRDCSQWLGCSSGETVLDPATNRYRDICTSLSLCDKVSETPGDIYCANYVDRTSTTTEPMFAQGSYFSSARYSARSVGLGQRDYTGYTIPNSFLVSDLVSKRVAVDGLPTDKQIGYRYAQDYRLVAAVPMGAVAERPSGSGNFVSVTSSVSFDAVVLSISSSDIARRYPSLSLCQHVPTGRIGFFSVADARARKQMFCYLPVSSDTDSYDFQNLSQKFQLETANVDALLTRAYPPPECRAYPEVDAPYPASFVTDWDLTVNPPKAKAKIAGYPNVTTCEYGEECACTYKRAEYQRSSVSKFFNALSQNIPPGICQGGPRDGQTCLPDTVFQIQGATDAAQRKAVEEANAALTCGPLEGGGICVPFSRISVIRGVFGQCLERDSTRSVGNDLGNNPCLTWNPNPVLFGDKDQFHFDPQTGYSPPENSGAYYCTSLVRPPRIGRFLADMFTGGLPGKVLRLAYGSEDNSLVGDNSHDNFFDGVNLPRTEDGGSLVGQQCGKDGDSAVILQSNPRTMHFVFRDGSLQILNENQFADALALKLVATGKTINESYSETFYKIDASRFQNIYGTAVSNADATLESNIANFSFSPILNPGGRGRLGCGYQADWVDNLGDMSSDTSKKDVYHDERALAQKDKDWREKFTQNFAGIMNRGSEDVLANPQTNHPYKMPCIQQYATDTSCYVKTWEIGYRDSGKEKFTELFGKLENGNIDYETGPIRTLEDIRIQPALRECTNDKSYFAIRAVFEAQADVGYQGDRSLARDFKKQEVRGPWHFVGFWVTTCAGQVNDTRYMYLYANVQSTDICRELAETRSIQSRQDAAFTDRVWKESQFKAPVVATQYDSRFSPFSSALNTKPPSRDPLVQAGAASRGVSKFEQPTFLGAGTDSYFRTNSLPNNKWAYLSNLFARIYRVYRYQDVPITKADSACFGGPNAGQFCTNSAQCSLDGQCRAQNVIPSDLTDVKFCNALSGINAGLSCASTDRNSDLCHLGPIVRLSDGTPKVLRKACVVNTAAGWSGSANSYRKSGAVPVSERAAASAGAFVCEPGSVRSGANMFCSKPGAESPDCPLRVSGSCEVDPNAIRYQSIGGTRGTIKRCRFNPSGTVPTRAQAQALGLAGADGFVTDESPTCTQNSDCSFDEYSFWSNGPVPYGVSPGDRVGSVFGVPGSGSVVAAPDDNHFWYNAIVPGSSGLWGPIYSIRSYINFEGSGPWPPGWCRDEETYPSTVAQVGSTPRPGTGACLFSTSVVGIPPDFDGLYVGSYNTNGDRPGLWPTLDHNTKVNQYQTAGVGSSEFNRFPGTGIAFTNARRDATIFFNLSACESVGTSTRRNYLGRCDGGAFADRLCRRYGSGASFSESNEPIRSSYSCKGTPGSLDDTIGPSGARSDYSFAYEGYCRPVTDASGQPVADCRSTTGDANSNDPDLDNNRCTHGIGYQPLKELCPDPDNEYCGLISYDPANAAQNSGLNPNSIFPLPTDVTMGHYTPDYLGFHDAPISSYSYISYKTPRPPRLAAPDLTRCASPGQCGILLMDTFTLNGRGEGVENISGGQHKSSIAFYAWADHNQMPIRSVTVDWGDGYVQNLPDAKIKNHKPFCGVQKECYVPGQVKHTGLTCDTDADCPPAAGSCKATGFCSQKQNISCADDNDCRVNGGLDTCVVRTLFGNSAEACETNYFEFQHVYNCNESVSAKLPLCAQPPTGGVVYPHGVQPGYCWYGSDTEQVNVANNYVGEGPRPCGTGGVAQCLDWYRSAGLGTALPAGSTCVGPAPVVTTEARCSRDTNRLCSATNPCAAGDTCVENGLAPVGGCWDPTANSCRFTPRVQVEDNWGWCTGECRSTVSGGALGDGGLSRNTDGSPEKTILHPFGGCYAGAPLNVLDGPPGDSSAVRPNTSFSRAQRLTENECLSDNPTSNVTKNYRRPWDVFQGSVQLRTR